MELHPIDEILASVVLKNLDTGEALPMLQELDRIPKVRGPVRTFQEWRGTRIVWYFTLQYAYDCLMILSQSTVPVLKKPSPSWLRAFLSKIDR